MKVKDYFLTKKEFDLKKTNIDGHLETYPIPEDLENYYNSDDYISHHQEKKTWFIRAYKLFQNYNLNYKKSILKKHINLNSKLLDYGCGSGDFLKYVEKDYQTFAYEPSKKTEAVLKNKIKAQLVNNLSEVSENSLNAISLWHVLEHIPNQKDIMMELISKLSDNGVLIIALPNHNSYDAKVYKNYWAAYDVPRHLHHYSKKGFKNFCKQENFNLIEIKALIWDAYYIALLSEKYRKSRLKFIRAIFIGTISNFKAIFNHEFSSLIYIIKK